MAGFTDGRADVPGRDLCRCLNIGKCQATEAHGEQYECKFDEIVAHTKHTTLLIRRCYQDAGKFVQKFTNSRREEKSFHEALIACSITL